MKLEKNDWREKAKFSAAKKAVEEVKDGFVIGLGSGSTTAYAIKEIGKRVREEGIRILGVPTSTQAYILAIENKIPVTTLNEHPSLDLTIDGADQIDKNLNMIKGMGAALTREKIVASASKKLVIIADETKLVEHLGENNHPVPVEVIPFSLLPVMQKIKKLGGVPQLREGIKKLGPIITDNGNFILDVSFGKIENPENLNLKLKIIPGVVETGLFIKLAQTAYIGKADGTVTKISKT